MPKPYSEDLREKIVKCFLSKMKHTKIAERFDVSLSTIRRYSVKYKAMGNLKVKKEIKTGRKSKITDYFKLKEFIKENNHLSLIDMAKKLGNISKTALHWNIKKAGLTFKKSHGFIERETRN